MVVDEDRSFWEPLLREGRGLLTVGSLGLLGAGGFAILQAGTREFLPHDVAYLGMTARQLCAHNACSIVHFMVHDRVAFGGVLVGLALLYLWLIYFPLAKREGWAWWVLAVSNALGFATFLTYLGTGYLDTWHGVATLFLLPCFGGGLWLAFLPIRVPRPSWGSLREWVMGVMAENALASRRENVGRRLLVVVAAVMVCAGVVITTVGMTVVFVPEDLDYMETTVEKLRAISPKLLPLIAHDRAGFGGGVLCLGVTLLGIVGSVRRVSRALWQVLCLAGVVVSGAAIGVHPWVGYNNPVHLAPAVVGAIVFFVGVGMVWRGRAASGRSAVNPDCDVVQATIR